MLACPFCGAAETDRFELEGRRFVVFGCMFTPEVPLGADDPALSEHLRRTFPAEGSGAYFRGICDRLHLHVTKGERARPPSGVPD